MLIIEVDAERRRLSLSLKRVEEGTAPLPRPDGAESVHRTPKLNLSEEVFAEDSAPPLELAPSEAAEIIEAAFEAEAEAEGMPELEVEVVVDESDEPAAESVEHAEPEPDDDTAA